MESKFKRHKIPLNINITAFYTFHYHEYPATFSFAGEAHDFWEIVYIDHGNVFFSRNHQLEESATKGQCIFHQPNEFHTIRAANQSAANVFIISFECRSIAMQFFKEKLISSFIQNLLDHHL